MDLNNLSRQQIEMMGRMGARSVPGHEGYSWAWVLNSFELNVWDKDISLTPHLKNDGFWEAWITSWFTRMVRPGMVVYDIGANCGYYTMIAEKLVGASGKVFAFEPNPTYVRALQNTRQMNNANFDILPFAVGDRECEVALYVPESLTGGASVNREITVDATKVIRVPQASLDEALNGDKLERPDVIKIDVEGYEEKVWDGMGKILVRDRPLILMEYTPHSYSESFYDKMTAWGTIAMIDGEGMEVPVSREYLMSLRDWVMIVVRKK